MIQFIVTRCLVFIFGLLKSLQIFISIIFGPDEFFKRVERKVPPKVLQDSKYGNHNVAFLKDQGIKIHYVEAGDSQKPLMLFVHGFPEFWFSWRYQMEEFKKDYRVVAIDLRGYNDSEGPEGIDNYIIENLCNDVKGIIEYLGYTTCVLVGHDWGGAIAWATTLRFPDLINTLVIMNAPHPGASIKYISKHPSQILKSWYMFFFQWPVLPELWIKAKDFSTLAQFLVDPHTGGASRISPDELEAYKYVFGKPGVLTNAINYYRANVLRQRGMTAVEIQCPVLIIWGTGDLYLETGLARHSLEFCKNERSRVRYLDGASHFVQQDRPEDCNRIMRDFLSGK